LTTFWPYYLIGAAVIGDLSVEVASAGRRIPAANWLGASAMAALAVSPMLIGMTAFGPLNLFVVGLVLLLAGGVGAAVDLPLSIIRNLRAGASFERTVLEPAVLGFLSVAFLSAYSGLREIEWHPGPGIPSQWGAVG
jgi:hypothetical protein